MVITVEASASGAQDGEVPIIHVAAEQAGGPVPSCIHEDVDISALDWAQAQPCPLPGSFVQSTQEEPTLGPQMPSSGTCKESCGVADRLRAAVASRGFEPCPVSEQPACNAPDSAQEAAAGLPVATVSSEGPKAMVLCHQDPMAGKNPPKDPPPCWHVYIRDICNTSYCLAGFWPYQTPGACRTAGCNGLQACLQSMRSVSRPVAGRSSGRQPSCTSATMTWSVRTSSSRAPARSAARM